MVEQCVTRPKNLKETGAEIFLVTFFLKTFFREIFFPHHQKIIKSREQKFLGLQRHTLGGKIGHIKYQ